MADHDKKKKILNREDLIPNDRQTIYAYLSDEERAIVTSEMRPVYPNTSGSNDDII